VFCLRPVLVLYSLILVNKAYLSKIKKYKKKTKKKQKKKTSLLIHATVILLTKTPIREVRKSQKICQISPNRLKLIGAHNTDD
jgi:hypothetical protein